MVQFFEEARQRRAPEGRIPPHNLDVEESLLGSMMLTRDAVTSAVEARLEQRDFYKPAHGHIYEAITSLNAAGEPADTVTVAEECEMLLYHVVTPRHVSPHATDAPPRDQVMFTVKDWPAWWRKNQGKSLHEVHADMRKVIDRYWQQGGVEQIVE